jgi:hypothetical protein
MDEAETEKASAAAKLRPDAGRETSSSGSGKIRTTKRKAGGRQEQNHEQKTVAGEIEVWRASRGSTCEEPKNPPDNAHGTALHEPPGK